MEYVKLGNTGLDVSRLCLGCMSFGVPERGIAPWSLNEESSRPIIKKALELGINFFDTANVYSDGTSEEIVGRALKDYANRDEIEEEKIGVIPWSPLAKGRLTRDWEVTTHRSDIDEIGKKFFPTSSESDRKVVERVAEVAETRGVPRAQIALAWVLQKEPITSPIIGSTKMTHLDDAVAALSIKLTQEEIAFLEEPYVPHPVIGFQ